MSTTTFTTEQIASLAALEVLNKDGKTVKMASLWQDEKTLVVFLRHFFCGFCKAYTTDLCAAIDPNSKVVFVGCGGYQPIKFYAEETGCTFPIYADPSESAYRALGMGTNLKAPEKQGTYVKDSVLSNALSSIKSAVTHPLLAMKGGDFRQNGGELVLGPGNAPPSFAHIMQHTSDHTEVEKLIKVAGLTPRSAPTSA